MFDVVFEFDLNTWLRRMGVWFSRCIGVFLRFSPSFAFVSFRPAPPFLVTFDLLMMSMFIMTSMSFMTLEAFVPFVSLLFLMSPLFSVSIPLHLL